MLTVRTGSRLHFGLTAFGESSSLPERRLYGGVGVMIDDPKLEVQLEPSDNFRVDKQNRADIAPRIRQVTENWLRYHAERSSSIVRTEFVDDLPVRIRCTSMPPAHSGFGSGTQLALAVVAGLQHRFQAEPISFADTIHVSSRGRRSTVGSYGFFHGGLIVDRGKFSDEPVSALECHERTPDAWRFVVLCPRETAGLHGEREIKAFRDIAPVPPSITSTLVDELHQQMLPAIRTADFERFAQSVWRYGSTAGSCFQAVQGGCFNGPIVTRLVEAIRSLGFEGVGQSSWGPGVFTVVPDHSTGEELLTQLANNLDLRDFDTWISPPRNSGHSIDAPDIATLHRPA